MKKDSIVSIMKISEEMIIFVMCINAQNVEKNQYVVMNFTHGKI